MSIKKETRLAVYQKYNGHCAYCGCEIELRNMQVDHVVPKAIGGADSVDNFLPTCRLCNHYKRGERLEVFREWKLGELIERLRKIYIFRVAEKYGMITCNKWDGKFYFEKVEASK